MTSDEKHIEDPGDSDGNADVSVFEKAEFQIGHARRLKRYVRDNIRRRADEGDCSAETGGEGERHELAGYGNLGVFTNAPHYGDEAGGGAGIRENRGHQGRDDHNARHELRLAGAKQPDDGAADGLREPRVKHGSADDEHAAEEDDRAVRQPRVNLFLRNQPQDPAGQRRENRGDREGNFLRDEQYRYDDE